MNLDKVKLKLSEKHIAAILLLFILISGTFLRIYKLDFQSLANDELSAWNLSKEASSVAEVVKVQAETDVNPPGYQIILYYVIHYLGETEFWLRLPSAIAGIISIYIIFLIGKKLYGLKEGLTAAAMLAFLWNPVYFSQEARTYSILLLFSMISVFFWLQILEGDLRKKYLNIFFYLVAAGITVSLHYFGILMISLQAAGMFIYCLFNKGNFKKFLITYGIILIFSLPLLPALITDFNPVINTYIKKPDAHSAADVLLYFFNSSHWFVLLAAILYFFLFIKIIYDLVRGRGNPAEKKISANIITFSWLMVPFISAYIISVLFLPVLTERNLIISLPAAYLLFSHSLMQLPLNELKKVFIAVLIIFIFLFHLIVKKDYYNRPGKVQFRETAQYVVENQKCCNPCIISYTWGEGKFEYYFSRMKTNFYVSAILGKKEDIDSLGDFIYGNNIESFWYIFGHRKPEKEFLDYMNGDFILVKRQYFYGAGAFFYKVEL